MWIFEVFWVVALSKEACYTIPVSFEQKANNKISFVSADTLVQSFYIVGARVPLQAEMWGRR